MLSRFTPVSWREDVWVLCYFLCIGDMLSKIKLLSIFTQCLPNYFSSFTQHQYSPNKSSTIYQDTIHTSTSSQHILNLLPSQYWPKFDQTLMLVDFVERCLISSLWHWDIQRSAKVNAPGLVNFITAIAYHFCLTWPAALTQQHLL